MNKERRIVPILEARLKKGDVVNFRARDLFGMTVSMEVMAADHSPSTPHAFWIMREVPRNKKDTSVYKAFSRREDGTVRVGLGTVNGHKEEVWGVDIERSDSQRKRKNS